MIHIFFQLMPDTTVSYFTIRCIELKSSIVEGYEKDSLERFLNQYVGRGVRGHRRDGWLAHRDGARALAGEEYRGERVASSLATP